MTPNIAQLINLLHFTVSAQRIDISESVDGDMDITLTDDKGVKSTIMISQTELLTSADLWGLIEKKLLSAQQVELAALMEEAWC